MEEIVLTASSFAGILVFGGWIWKHKKHNKALNNCGCCGKMHEKCTCADEHWFIG